MWCRIREISCFSPLPPWRPCHSRSEAPPAGPVLSLWPGAGTASSGPAGSRLGCQKHQREEGDLPSQPDGLLQSYCHIRWPPPKPYPHSQTPSPGSQILSHKLRLHLLCWDGSFLPAQNSLHRVAGCLHHRCCENCDNTTLPEPPPLICGSFFHLKEESRGTAAKGGVDQWCSVTELGWTRRCLMMKSKGWRTLPGETAGNLDQMARSQWRVCQIMFLTGGSSLGARLCLE